MCDRMEQRKENIRTESKKLLEDLRGYQELASNAINRLVESKKAR